MTFQCDCCGIHHPHDESTHDLKVDFDLPTGWINNMDYSPHCNCGLWEAYIDAREGRLDVEPSTLNELEKATQQFPIPKIIKEDLVSDETPLSGF